MTGRRGGVTWTGLGYAARLLGAFALAGFASACGRPAIETRLFEIVEGSEHPDCPLILQLRNTCRLQKDMKLLATTAAPYGMPHPDFEFGLSCDEAVCAEQVAEKILIAHPDGRSTLDENIRYIGIGYKGRDFILLVARRIGNTTSATCYYPPKKEFLCSYYGALSK